MPTDKPEPVEVNVEEMGTEENMKPKKMTKSATKKKTTLAEAPFEPLVPETWITISAVEDATLFVIPSTGEKFFPDLGCDLADVKADAKCVVPVVSEYYKIIEKMLYNANTKAIVSVSSGEGDGRDGCLSHCIGLTGAWDRKRPKESANTIAKC